MPRKIKPSSIRENIVLLQGFILLLLVLIPTLRLYQLDQPVVFLLPNLLLLTPWRQYTRELWFKYVNIDKRVRRAPVEVPIIEAEDYTFDALRKATENWRYPAVVRGLFKGAPALEKWLDPTYLPSLIGNYSIPVVRKAVYGTIQNDRAVLTFDESFNEIMTDENSKMYLFFPVQSRFNFNGSEAGTLAQLTQAVNDVVQKDLEIDSRIWNGFGTKAHSTFFGSQLIIGKGSADTKETTGTGWHCAAGNNYFVQVYRLKILMQSVNACVRWPVESVGTSWTSSTAHTCSLSAGVR